ncbi:MAG: molybdopterin molybdotransferase MoeA [Armatimonadetes bacterium]|nr:molybdopterin molybdotransferase MoeA [Armatimonadota bacterium]
MISVDETLRIVEANRWQGGCESVPLASSVGRILAEDIVASQPSPPFDNSAMDGYAVNPAGSGPWRLSGEVMAGTAPATGLQSGCAVRIFTGAMLPSGTAAVLPQENAAVDSDSLVATVEARPGAFIREAGEEYPADFHLARAGQIVNPPMLSSLAAAGYAALPVTRMPSVAILSTGSELLSPGSPPEPAKIFESNSATLVALLQQMGCVVVHEQVEDDLTKTSTAIRRLLESCDLLLTIGGASVGDYDFVRQVMLAEGFKQLVGRIAVRPGRPTCFGIKGDKAWFGLPGNPMSALVMFSVFVRAYLGHAPNFQMRRLAEGYQEEDGRERFIPARHVEAGLELLPTVGSHATFSLPRADGLARLPEGAVKLNVGDAVQFIALPWSPA